MKQERSIGILRLLEQIALLCALGGLLFVLWWFIEQHSLDVMYMVAGGVAGLLGFVVFIYANQKVSHKINLITTQNDFALDAQFMALFEQSPVPYLVIDREGNIIRTNHAATKLLRRSNQDLLGTDLLSRFTRSEATDISIVINKIQAGVTVNDVEVALQLNSEEELWVLLSAYISEQKDQSYISLVDVTQAKKVDVAKSEFLALATHQLGTPIAAIRWNAELLAKKIPDQFAEVTGPYLTKITNNIKRMTALMDDFLNVSKLELGTFASTPTEFNVTTFLDGVVDEFSQKLQEKQIVLERTENPQNFNLRTDEQLFHIVVSNLLSNATKYVREAGTIQISTSVQDNRFVFQIADNGIGIPQAEIENLFTKFYRASNATKHQAEGTGLGLYVIGQALDLLGGTIDIATDNDKGAAFTITIPLQ